jgi:carboxylesterase type B
MLGYRQNDFPMDSEMTKIISTCYSFSMLCHKFVNEAIWNDWKEYDKEDRRCRDYFRNCIRIKKDPKEMSYLVFKKTR